MLAVRDIGYALRYLKLLTCFRHSPLADLMVCGFFMLLVKMLVLGVLRYRPTSDADFSTECRSFSASSSDELSNTISSLENKPAISHKMQF